MSITGSDLAMPLVEDPKTTHPGPRYSRNLYSLIEALSYQFHEKLSPDQCCDYSA
jgi:hypothetical protein